MNNFFLMITALLFLPATGFADDKTNRYSVISRRNAFALTTPAAATVPGLALAESVKIKLTGIAVIPPQKWAALQVQPPGKPAFPIVLGEGRSEGTVEVVKIDARANQVTLRNSGELMNLTFENVSTGSKSGTLPPQLADDRKPLPAVPPPDANP